jgi:hypothetical protein
MKIKTFAESLQAAVVKVTKNRSTLKTGTLLFDKDSFKNNALYPIAKLIRYVFYKLQITDEEYKEKFQQYSEALLEEPSKIHTNRRNLLDALKAKTLTIKQFEKALTVMQFSITDIQYTIRSNETGETYTFALSDINKEIENDKVERNGSISEE